MLETAVQELEAGICIGDHTVFVKKLEKGRFPKEIYLDLYVRRDTEERHLMYVSVYYGRPPYYRPRVEFFGVDSRVDFNESTFRFYGFTTEDRLLALFGNYLGPGEKLFVEYFEDPETNYGLIRNFPAVITRLGYKLFQLGFTWFKDWYYPEGFMEGGQKLQGEKPLNMEYKQKHLGRIEKEIKSFLDQVEDLEHHEFVTHAIKRGIGIQKELENIMV